MTSKNETDRFDELKIEAKELGMKGVHFSKDADHLSRRIAELKAKKTEAVEAAEAKAEEKDEEMVDETVAAPVVQDERPEFMRKKAPAMSVSSAGHNERLETLKRLEAMDPDSKYIYQPASMSDEKLAAKKLQRTGLTFNNDIICRTDRNKFHEVQEARNADQHRAMSSIDPSGTKIKSLEAQVKTIKPRE